MKRKMKQNIAKKKENRKENYWKEFFKPTDSVRIIFVIIFVFNLFSVYFNFYNKCGGSFCGGIANSLSFALFSLPLAAFSLMVYPNVYEGLILLAISIAYNYFLACLIVYIINKVRKK